MTDSAIRDEIDLTDCDREPIHVPQAVQPHGFLLVLDLKPRWCSRAPAPSRA
ncbi:hypothetical protein MU852_14690 [Brevundimonas albigilva]|uniref:hypothetical protein n=1 Tax=Brevundimonas albigilva TaxID=1312364 RepID=UPI00201B51F6|nr:hypothetical protein [Brevundimonas albigilva]UQV18006.1 hypothetical protein MU852_14690 [Brevundimonas albigilva]